MKTRTAGNPAFRREVDADMKAARMRAAEREDPLTPRRYIPVETRANTAEVSEARRAAEDVPLYDRCRPCLPLNPEVRLGLLTHGDIDMHRTDRDSRQPRTVVTAQIMGDPSQVRRREAHENAMRLATRKLST